LAGGFQQGVGFVQDLQDARQRNKMRKYALSQAGRDEAAAQANSTDVSDEERGFYGDQTAEAFMPEFGQDPWLFRMMDKMKSRKGKRKTALPSTEAAPAAPVEAAPADLDGGTSVAAPAFMPGDDPDLYSGGGYADGGRVDFDSPEEIRKRAAQNRANNSERGGSTTRAAEGADKTAKASRGAARGAGGAGEGAAAAEGAAAGAAAKKGLLRRALGSKLAGGAAAGAGIAGAIRAGGTGSEDYYTRFGMDPSEAGLSFWKDLGTRAMGTLTDVGDAAGQMVGLDPRSRFADEIGKGGIELTDDTKQRVAALGGAAGARRALAARDGAPGAEQLPDMTVRAGASGGGGARPQAAPQPSSPELGDAIDLADVDIDETELPDLKVDDWKRYRAQALRTARLKGLPQAEALDSADKLVTGMQIRGFSNYAGQASALMQAGNLKGATRALRAAYQYFPDGNDVKFGVHNGHIVAVGVDEKTGEQFKGGTHVITPEYLAGAIQNFQNPQNFLAWTKDWRGEQFEHQKYNEVTKPLAEAQGQALRTNAEANVARSEAAQMRAQMSGGMGGMKPADMRGSEQVYRQRLELMGITDEAQADQLASVMSQIKQANPKVPDNMIVDFVMKAQGRPDGAAFIQRALSGQ
jgi:hypothetical protein